VDHFPDFTLQCQVDFPHIIVKKPGFLKSANRRTLFEENSRFFGCLASDWLNFFELVGQVTRFSALLVENSCTNRAP